jgi:hypothetical protein
MPVKPTTVGQFTKPIGLKISDSFTCASSLYFFLATVTYEGVKIPFSPASTISKAVAFKRADTLVLPFGAMRIVSKNQIKP